MGRADLDGQFLQLVLPAGDQNQVEALGGSLKRELGARTLEAPATMAQGP